MDDKQQMETARQNRETAAMPRRTSNRKRNRKFSRIAALSLLTVMMLAISACSGSGGQANQTNQADNSAPAGEQNLPDGKIVSAPLTLSYYANFTGTTPNVKSFNDVVAYQVKEQKTGIHIDFISPAVGTTQGKDQFNLMMSSGDYPDIIEWGWPDYPGGGLAAMDNGVILPLNDYIDKYAPNFSKVLKDNPEVRKQVTTDDGRIYAFPLLRIDPYLLTYEGPALRKDWLDKLGLQVPTTIDEWHTVLKAFKEQDPNGNSKADEIPLLINKNLLLNFSNVFLNAWGINGQFSLKNGEIIYGPMQPEYKEFLQTMQDWYKEGLIDPDYAATDDKQKDAKVTGELLGAAEMAHSGGIGKYMTAMKSKDPKFELVGAPYPTLNKGDKPQLGQTGAMFGGVGAAITKSNKHIIESVKWLDYNYGEEGHMLFNFGVEGQSYNMVNGYPTYTDEIMKNPDGLSFGEAIGKYALPFGMPFVQDKRYQEQNAALPQQKAALATWMDVDNSGWLPPLSFTTSESARAAALMADITTYRDEMFDKFVMGAESLDHFDQYAETLNKMGINELLEIEKAAYERYVKR
ncbi:extracellular solute-binding protein [Paenibacillus physcomitrellae]|uniref:Sugar ABC transporter permease n=1 Tax=Paenibacillus physcomitrellae TaxID=1619311 RepID=A0ABQ1GS38_9BACL|nr:extracellular solute-binding protein [Paenibacillus physcomitrellae]GGA48986.1 sugar ABC transporter permease [Paenibacillus physcomitrellae]